MIKASVSLVASMSVLQLHPDATRRLDPRGGDVIIERVDIIVLSSIGDNTLPDIQNSTYLWLRETFPIDFPHTRVLLFRQDGSSIHAKCDSDSVHQLLDILLRSRRRDPFRPIIFIVDSTSSIFLRGVLAEASRTPLYGSIKQSARGVVFLSTASDSTIYSPPLKSFAWIAERSVALVKPLHDERCSISLRKTPVDSLERLNHTPLPKCLDTLLIVSLFSSGPSATSLNGSGFGTRSSPENTSVVVLYGRNITLHSLDQTQYRVLRDRISWLFQRIYETEPKILEIDYEDLQWLHHLYPDGLLSRENDILDPLDGTCAWIWSNSTFNAWLSSEDERNFWIAGKPGAGKSVLAKYIARSLAAENHSSHPSSEESLIPSRQTRRVAWFFCDYRSPPQDAESIFRYILHQLLANQPSIIKRITPYVKSTRDWSLRTTITLTRLYLRLTKPEIVYLVLDGLDECNEAVQRDMRDAMEKWSCVSIESHPAQPKVLVTSRPYGRDHSPLRHMGHGIDLSENECAPGLSHDAFLVVGAGMTSLWLDERMVTALTPTIEKLIFGKDTAGVLLWARLANNSARVSKSALLDAGSFLRYLTNLPTDLFALYHSIFDHLRSENPRQSQIALRVLSWVCVSKRPLTVQELEYVAEIEGSCHDSHPWWVPHLDIRTEGYGLNCSNASPCFSNLSIVLEPRAENRVRFIHQSVQDFLLGEGDEKGKRPFLAGSATDIHSRVAHHCFSVLAHTTTRINSDTEQMLSTGWIVTLPGEHALLEYAATHWLAHFTAGRKHDINLTRSFDTLTNPKSRVFKYWFNIWWGSHLTQGSKAHGTPKYLTRGTLLSFLGMYQEIDQLLQLKGMEVDECPSWEQQWTPLSAAAWSGHIAIVDLLLHYALKRQSRLRKSSQALTYAIHRGHTDVAKAIVKAFPSLGISSDILETATFESARARNLKLLRWLVEGGANVNTHRDGRSLLDIALCEGDIAITEMLLDAGADVHQALHLTPAIQSGSIEKLRLLVKSGWKTKQTDEHGQTALHIAALYANQEIVRLLLEFGTAIDRRDNMGHTALHHGVRSGDITIVKLLSHSGLKPSTEDFMAACEQASVQVVKYLLSLGLNANSTLDGRSAIHHALSNEHSKYGIAHRGTPSHEESRASIIASLLEMGADVHYKDYLGNTALHYSCNICDKRVSRLLLDHGADTGQTNRDGKTPLDLAVIHGDPELTLLLLNSTHSEARGSNTTWKNALESSNFDAIRCLFEKGLFPEPQNLCPRPSEIFQYFVRSNSGPDRFAEALNELTELQITDLSNIWVVTENTYSLSNTIKEWFEGFTGTVWDWSPFQDPVPCLKGHEAWVRWRCTSRCTWTHRKKVPLRIGENIKELQSYVTMLVGLESKTEDEERHESSTTPTLAPRTHRNISFLRRSLALRKPTSLTHGESRPPTSSAQLGTGGAPLELPPRNGSSSSRGGRRRRCSSLPGHTTRSQTPNEPRQLGDGDSQVREHGPYVLCMPKSSFLEHINMKTINNDSQFLDTLLRIYENNRGVFRRFFSIMRFHHWGFDKYTRFDRKIFPTSSGSGRDTFLPTEAPHDKEYEFKRVNDSHLPPIRQRIFFHHYSCYMKRNRRATILGSTTPDLERADPEACHQGRELMDRVPKRHRQWSLCTDDYDEAYGLSAFELPCLLWFVGYSLVIFAAAIVFVGLWLSFWGHSGDLQDATIPATFFLMIWTFMYQRVRGKRWNRDEEY